MRHAVLALSFAFVGLTASAREAAACEIGEDGEIEDCEEDIAVFDERFDEDATFLEKIQLELGGFLLRQVVIRWSDDDDENYVDYEIETDFDGLDSVDFDTDPDVDPDLDPDDV